LQLWCWHYCNFLFILYFSHLILEYTGINLIPHLNNPLILYTE